LWCLQSTAALPFGTIVIILIIWGLVTIPLTVAGGIAGKNNRADFAAPCRTNKYPREIPELPWYRWVLDVVANERDQFCMACRLLWWAACVGTQSAVQDQQVPTRDPRAALVQVGYATTVRGSQ
jgi:hypothetical protein